MRYTAPAGQAGLLSFRRAWKQVPLHELHNTQTEYITMKKTLITLLALAGAAAAAGEEVSTVITSVMPESAPTWKTYTFTATDEVTTTPWINLEWNSIQVSTLTKDFNLLGITSDGHYTFSSKGEGQSSSYPAISFADGVLTLTGRPNTSGETYYANVVDLDTIMGGGSKDVDCLKSLTVTISGSGSSDGTQKGDSWWGLYTMSQQGEITQISNLKSNDLRTWNTGTKELSFTEAQIGTLSESDKIVILFRQAANAPLNISDISVTATLIPEPATATLSLLALCGLAARRRRA